ncbi:MAG: hypothetical protein ABFS12_05855 [Bacteroidota bacterium]
MNLKFYTKINLLSFAILFTANINAQEEIFPPANLQFKKHNINKVYKTVTNYGSLVPTYNYEENVGIVFNYPPGSNQELTKVGGAWLGAIVGRDTLVTQFSDYEAVGGGGRGQRFEVFPRFNDNDTIYKKSIFDEILENAGPQYFFHEDGRLDERYKPKSAQDYICQYWDNKIVFGVNQAPEILEDHIPMNARIIQRSFAYDFFLYDKILFMEYIIINEGDKNWEDIFFVQYNDVNMRTDKNVGPVGDDYAKFDKERRMIYWGDMPGGPDGTMLNDTRKAFRLVGGPTDVNASYIKPSFRHWVHSEDSDNDRTAYGWISQGEIQPDMSEEIPTGTSTRGIFSVGPFPTTMPGDTIRFMMATIVGDGYDDMIISADAAKTLYESNFSVPISPSPPKIRLKSKRGAIVVNWEWLPEYTGTNPEEFEDKSRTDGIQVDFDGYRVYRSSEGSTGPWELVGEFDKVNGHGYDTGLKYELEDKGLINGIRYWYTVTSYDIPEVVSDKLTIPSLESPKILSTAMAIPAITIEDSEEEGVFVVPNPYRGDIDYTTNPGWEYSTQPGRSVWFEIDRRIAFMNLPPQCKITILTIAGYEVKTIDFDQGSGSPIAYWNLLNKNNHTVASGLYYFVVEQSGQKNQIGKFVIVK